MSLFQALTLQAIQQAKKSSSSNSIFQTGELQKSSADKKGDNKLCFQNEIELSKAT